MQSQQKKVKWSRGETADALEERTDTGITQVSVSRLENIIADIYGNISRRPALKTISSVSGATDIPVISGTTQLSNSSFVRPAQSFVFTIDANSYIIFIVDALARAFGGLLVQNGKFVKRVTITNNTDWTPFYWGWEAQISAAQYNNFMVVSNIYIGDVTFQLTDTNDVVVEKFQFSAPWYAANGTESVTVSNADLPGLEFNKDGNGFTAFAWTDSSGLSSPYSVIDTGLTGDTQAIAEAIPEGSIVKFPNLGAYMRVEGYIYGTNSVLYFPEYEFDGVLTSSDPVPGSGLYVKASYGSSTSVTLTAYKDGAVIKHVVILKPKKQVLVRCSASSTGISSYSYETHLWTDASSAGLKIQMFGPLLTPVANKSGKDTIVTVETGYVSLQNYTPTKFTFSNQRLYAAGFYNPDGTPKRVPGYAVGSQIARYNDFKNDYNTQNEAVVIDISTAYQEQIVALVDYNGLKLLTDSAEYSYSQQSGIIKQSENGSLATCKPLVFGSVCLYADKSGAQIRAMQYELQTDLFTSSSINLMAQKDLIFNTNTMAGNLDKEHYNGRFLYATQTGYALNNLTWGEPIADHTLAVCNFVPGNQAMIWARWTCPELKIDGNTRHSIVNAIEVNNKIWFVMACEEVIPGLGITSPAYTLAELDYDSVLDGETTAVNTEYRIVPATRNNDMFAWTDQNDPTNTVYTHTENVLQGDNIYDADDNVITTANNSVLPGTDLEYIYLGTSHTASRNTSEDIYIKFATMPGATVSVFDGDQYMWDDTLDSAGNYTRSLADLTNPRIGFMINATLESHPIDVGGRTYTDHKRIGKAVAVIRDTEPNAFTVCDRTGYTSVDKKKVNFYGCTGMKDQIRYTIKNIQGAKFTIESLSMIIEYATLDS